MDTNTVAILIQESGRLISGLMRLRPPKSTETPEYISALQAAPSTKVPAEFEQIPVLEQAEEGESSGANTDENIEGGTACLPCTNSHLHACVGLLNEATRMSRDGINGETFKRVNNCLGEIIACERIDLTPQKVANLPPKEKKIADRAVTELRQIRHSLEGLSSPEQLEQIAAKTANLQDYIGSEWFKYKLGKGKEHNE